MLLTSANSLFVDVKDKMITTIEWLKRHMTDSVSERRNWTRLNKVLRDAQRHSPT